MKIKINEELCIGCGNCVPYCPNEAISIKEKRAVIDYNRCTYCSTCYTVAPCPVKGALEPIPIAPRSIVVFTTMSPIVGPRHVGVGGGTILSDVAPQVRKGEVGFAIEIGRPCLAATLKEIQKVALAIGKQVDMLKPQDTFSKKVSQVNPLEDIYEGLLDEDLLKNRVRFLTLEFKVREDEVPKVLKILKNISETIDNVMSVSILQRVAPSGEIPITKKLEEMGIEWLPNGETNLGISRPHKGNNNQEGDVL